MKTLKINPYKPDRKVINKSITTILEGGLVVYPTDTAYGIAASAVNEKAIENLYRIKNRGLNKPTHVVVKDWKMIKKLTITNRSVKVLFEKFIPGPLTLILKKRPDSPIPQILSGRLPTLGVRIPDCQVTQIFSEFLKLPYTTPSANKEGESTPYSIGEVKKVLDLSLIDLVLDAGSLPRNLPSTVADLTKNTPKILREGPITNEQINEVLKKIRSETINHKTI